MKYYKTKLDYHKFDMAIFINDDIVHLSDIAPKLIFFDIETSSLSASHGMIFLIGCIVYDEDDFHLLQWFAESLSDEKLILEAFFDMCKNKSILISYNGKGFDERYISSCAKQYHIDSPLESMQHIDIYESIRPYKKFMTQSSLSQRAMEEAIGSHRTDRLSGKDVSSLYSLYTKAPEDGMLDFILLHNHEDCTGMLELLSLVNIHAIHALLAKEISYEATLDIAQAIDDETSSSSHVLAAQSSHAFSLGEIHINISYENTQLLIKIEYPFFVPIELLARTSSVIFSMKENIASISISIHDGIAYHFFADYRNYYYLPAEDIAVYKSVGQFVDKSRRERATASTAYAKKEGRFIPLFGDDESFSQNIFQLSYKDELRYIEEDVFKEKTAVSLISYIEDILRYLKLQK